MSDALAGIRVLDLAGRPAVETIRLAAPQLDAEAEATAEAGADAVCLINTVRGMAVDWRRRRPILAYDVGGLSGPAIKPISKAVKAAITARKVKY